VADAGVGNSADDQIVDTMFVEHPKQLP